MMHGGDNLIRTLSHMVPYFYFFFFKYLQAVAPLHLFSQDNNCAM